jgi:hypothetical protein
MSRSQADQSSIGLGQTGQAPQCFHKPAVAQLQLWQVDVKVGTLRQELCHLLFGPGYSIFQIVNFN